MINTQALLKSVRELDMVPNAPFFPRPAARALIIRLGVLGLRRWCEVRSDHYALYVRFKNGDPRQKLLIISHLDHPGFVTKHPNLALPLGSAFIPSWPQNVALRIYDGEGEFKRRVGVEEVHPKRPALTLSAEMKTNWVGVWDLPDVIVTDTSIVMVAADNTVCTAAALSAFSSALEHNPQNVDVTFVFPFVEEVFQLSTTGIALRMRTPFASLDENTIIVNLEAMEAKCTQKQAVYIAKKGLRKPTYTDGILVKVNDIGVVYGEGTASDVNLAEELLLKVCGNMGIPFQHTLTSGSTDATALSVFPTTPHIATLAVPCRNKHNWPTEGQHLPSSESVFFADVKNMAEVLAHFILTLSAQQEVSPTGRGLSTPMRNERDLLGLDPVNVTRKNRLKAFYSMRRRLQRQRFLPQTVLEGTVFALDMLIANVLTFKG